MNIQNHKKNFLVTVLVIPREKFSYTRMNLESIYQYSDIDFDLVYVDSGSPSKYKKYLEDQSQKKGFTLIRRNYYQCPNQSRNLGLRYVKTKYVVLIDNDVSVEKGWLSSLVNCAEETGADLVGPLTCQIKNNHLVVHCAGGESGIKEVKDNGVLTRHIIHNIHFQAQKVQDIENQLKRIETQFTEFHCALARREIFDRVGYLDVGMKTNGHVDYCLSMSKGGGSIYFEPSSRVTFYSGPILDWKDIPFYMLRWSNDWERKTLHHLRNKWNLTEDKFFEKRYRELGKRRREKVLQPLSQKILPNSWLAKGVEGILVMIDRLINPCLAAYYSWRYGKHIEQQTQYPGT